MTISLYLILWLLTIHYVADWVMQSRADARAKSHCNRALTNHVCTYSAILLFVLLQYPRLSSAAVFEYVLLNGVLHWITDWVTSRLNVRALGGATLLANTPKTFWCGIGADQLIHSITLILTAAWLLTLPRLQVHL